MDALVDGELVGATVEGELVGALDGALVGA